jgi:epoxyqueuosine reductase
LNISAYIKQSALELGLSACGITDASVDDADMMLLNDWLSKGYHADMDWMYANLDKRTNPSLLFEGAKSAIVVLQNYFPKEELKFPQNTRIAKYAYGHDYHFVVKEKLNKLLDLIKQQVSVEGRAFVDSAPVMERALARKAGLGWIGKHSLLINKELGSFVFIGVLLVNIELAYDLSFDQNLCGTCTKCIDVCPTSAIVEPRIVDARKCLAYQTIENKGEIPASISKTNPGWIFGCDCCQDVCPWNRKAIANTEKLFEPLPQLLDIKEDSLINLSSSAFNRIYKKSPLSRAGLKSILRNIRSIQQQLPE